MKLLHEDSESYHLLHPSGKRLVLKKSGLSPEAIEQIKHFDRGGEATDKDTPSESSEGSYGQSSGRYSGYDPDKASPSDSQPAQPSDEAKNLFHNAFKKAEGGIIPKETMGHQTKHKPNPKLAQVPNKDRYANNILKEYYAGGSYDQGGSVPPPQTPVESAQESMRKAFHFAHGHEVKVEGNDTPVSASKLEAQYAPEEEAAQEAAGPAPSSAPTIHNHYYMSPSMGNQPPPSSQVDPGAQGFATPNAPVSSNQQPVQSLPPVSSDDLVQQAKAANAAEDKSLLNMGQAGQTQEVSNVSALDAQQQHLQDMSNRMEHYGQQYHQSWDNIANNTNPTIDPNHFWASKSTPNRILSSIGFLLGGAGLGVSGHPELAGKAIQDAINRDIESQKATFNNKDNMLKQYSDMYHSTILGEDALRLQYGAQTENLIKRAAAQAGTQTAMDQANLTIAKNRQDLLKNMSNLAQGQVMIDMSNRKRQMMNQSPNSEQDPSSMVPYVVPPEQQKEVFNEIKKAQDATHVEQTMLQKFDQAAKENTVLRTGAGVLRTPASVMELDALSLPLIHDAEGRVNEYEAKTLKDLRPAPGDTDSKIRQKRQGLIDFIQQKKSAPTAKGFGIDLSQYRSTAGHPDNEIPYKTMNGAQYRKVPGGWQKVQ